MSTLPRDLLELAERGKLVPLVGAGASMSLRGVDGHRLFRNWAGVLELAAEELRKNGKITEATGIDAMLLLSMFPEAAEVAKRGFVGASWGEFLVKLFDVSCDRIESSSLALPRALWNVSNRIITLNFDKVLRYACPRQSVIELDNSMSSQLANFLRDQENRDYVWHLHGRIDNLPSLILTKQSYADLYQREQSYKAALTALRDICCTQNLLFVGCSLDDAELLAEIGEVARLFDGNVGPHYALVRKDEVGAVSQKLKGLPFEIVPFDDFGGPLVEMVKLLARPIDAPSLPPVKTGRDRIKIAVLLPDALDKRFEGMEILKEIRKFKCEIHHYALNLENLNSLNDFDYVFIISAVHRGRVLAEDEWLASCRFSVDEIVENIADSRIAGVFFFLDSVALEEDSLRRLEKHGLPVAIYPGIKKNQLSTLQFKLFKKREIGFVEGAIVVNEILFAMKELSGTPLEFKKRSPLSEAIDPKSVRNFVGRESDLRDLCKQVIEQKNNNDVLTLKGAGGVGKTILAKKVAVELSARNIFFAGIDFVDCEFFNDYKTFEHAIARIFSLEQAVNVKQRLREYISREDRLIILDNVESILQLEEHALILELISLLTDFATVVVTSREILRIENEKVIEVRQLSTDEAVELFLQGIGNSDISDDDKKFIRERIVEDLLENNPLAIKLITRNIPRGKDFRVLHRELEQDIFSLSDTDVEAFHGASDRNVERKKSLYASIFFSYSRLNEKEKIAFELLSLFPDGINLEALKSISERQNEGKRNLRSNNNPATQFLITDTIIKALEDKSIIQVNNKMIRLQSLVGRFSEQQFNRRSAIDMKRFQRNAFEYNSNVAAVLSDLADDEPLMVSRIFSVHEKNFIKATGFVNSIDVEPDSICHFLFDVSQLSFTSCSYAPLLKTLNKISGNFEAESKHRSCIEVIQIVHRYFNGEFADSFEHLQKFMPLAKIFSVPTEDVLFRAIMSSALNIYAMEGHVLKSILAWKRMKPNWRDYPELLYAIGEYDEDLIRNSLTSFFTLEAKHAIGKLTVGEVDNYISGLYKKQHLEIMQANYLRLKLAGSVVGDLEKLVVVNPYSAGIKHLMRAFVESDFALKKEFFQAACKNLVHIKYYYVEAILFYSEFLKEQGISEEFNEVSTSGIVLSTQYGYRHLLHKFEVLRGATYIEFDTRNYPLPSDEEYGDAISHIKAAHREVWV